VDVYGVPQANEVFQDEINKIEEVRKTVEGVKADDKLSVAWAQVHLTYGQ
jgi:hypothetical protein